MMVAGDPTSIPFTNVQLSAAAATTTPNSTATKVRTAMVQYLEFWSDCKK
jgi:hypothetical protein